jgi:hexokinase
MGLIVGTGTNATVPMRVSELHPKKKDDIANAETVETVVINTEWTIRGTDQPLVELGIKTPWDQILDANSEAPGFQPFEYMTSGRYLGEIVRLVFVDLISRDSETRLPVSLASKNALQTQFLSEVVARANDKALAAELERQYPSSSTSNSFWNTVRVRLLRDIAYAVQRRSSALIAAACVGLLDCVHEVRIDPNPQDGRLSLANTEPEELVIAYTGSTISHYPEWLITCQRWIDTLVANGSASNVSKRVVLRETRDGGIVGAGVLAGMADVIA